MLLVSLLHDLLAGKKAMEKMQGAESIRFKMIARRTGRTAAYFFIDGLYWSSDFERRIGIKSN